MTLRSLNEIADGVWIDHGPIRIVGMPLTSTMTVLRLDDGALLLHSPIEMTPERREDVEALGPVAHLYSPNLFHHLWLGDWAEALASARVHAPAGLRNKRKDLRIDRVHTEPEPSFDGIIDEVPIDGFRLSETVLLHRPSRTLIVTDLVHNIGQPDHWWVKTYAGLMGFYGQIALSRVIRWTAFSDRAAARKSLDQVLALPFDRIVVGHGDPIVEGAKDALASAFAWL